MIFSVDETMDIGCEYGTMVAEDYTAGTSKFNGKINWVQLDQGADDHDHLISPEERLHLAMSGSRFIGFRTTIYQTRRLETKWTRYTPRLPE